MPYAKKVELKRADTDGASPFVYVRSKEHAWLPGRVVDSDDKHAVVAVQKYKSEEEMLYNTAKTEGSNVQHYQVELKDYESGVLPMQNVSDSGRLGDYEDMVNLPYLHEAGILYNVKIRHMQEKPYTRCGDLVVAVNPYKWFDHIYTEKQRKLYANKLVWELSEEDPRNHLKPHVYETSALSYRGMCHDGKNQSILVSGESGAGKTETVKICMNHIASVQEGPNEDKSQSSESALVVQRVLDSNPLLEAFGNAKTRRNDNSSRFGKYTQLQFDRVGEIGRPLAWLAGSVCDVYLLEKNRVVSHETGERSFHIFYQLLASDDDVKSRIWDGLIGTKNESFKYIGATDTDTIEGVHDEDRFHETLSVLQLLGLDWRTQVREFLRAICIVMQLGNLTFGAKEGSEDESVITSRGALQTLAGLMEIPEDELEIGLTERTMKTQFELYKVPLKPSMARDSADALAKEIYSKMFLWLVGEINEATCAEKNYTGGTGKDFGIIGLLDIFGFESFAVNRFEQLCINYANEKLQQKFTQDIFRSVQEEYDWEGIPLAEIKYDDNTDVLDLVEGDTGLCALLNEECVRPKGSGAGFVNKALASNRKSACLVAQKTSRLCFGIKHYAGTVFYDAENFVTSNMDTLATDLQDCAMKCSNPLILAAFDETVDATKATPKRRRSNIKAPTVWTKYKDQLAKLMKNLYSTRSRYIRCIKPNSVKAAGKMEHDITVEQLRYAGIVAGVTISRSSFPNRLGNLVVFKRYKEMWDKSYGTHKEVDETSSPEEVKEACEQLLEKILESKEVVQNGVRTKAFVVGKTRAYFRAGALETLESKRVTGLDGQAVTIQRYVRGFLVRKEKAKAARAEELEAEALRRKEQERLEQLERERQEKEEQHKEIMKQYFLEVQALKKKIKEEDDRTKALVDAAEARERQANAEREALEEKLNNEVEAKVRAFNNEMASLKTRLEANMKMMDHLRKENKKLHKVSDKVDDKLKNIRKNHKRLSVNFDESFSVLDEMQGSFNEIGESNRRLSAVRDGSVEKHRELKEQVHKIQGEYMAMAEARLELQKTLAYILNAIGDDCVSQKLIDDTFDLAHECEKQKDFIMEALESNPNVPDLLAAGRVTMADKTMDESVSTEMTWMGDESQRSLYRESPPPTRQSLIL